MSTNISTGLVDLVHRGSLINVGDVNGTTRGSGARFNAGKVPYELVPIRVLSSYIRRIDGEIARVLAALARWQEGGDTECLEQAIDYVSELTRGRPVDAFADCARVFDYGRRKYSEWNWARGMAWSIPLACAVRHLLKMAAGEANDDESGLPHAGHVVCNLVMLATFFTTYPEGDDRPKDLLRRPESPAGVSDKL